MYNKTYFKNKDVLVLGLAVSGFSAAKVLKELGARVTVNDFKSLKGDPAALELQKMDIQVVSGGHPLELLDQPVDLIVKNPGIPYSNPLLAEAANRGIPIITDVEIADSISQSMIIAITGTNGKTTTTRMIESLLASEQLPGEVYSVGNIGQPAAEVAVSSRPEDKLVMEVSSFQLMGTRHFKPSIAVITNIHSAHLDYHGSRKEYVDAKLNITRNQTSEDYLIYNHDQLELTELVIRESKAQLLPFSRKDELNQGVYLKDSIIYFDKERIMDSSDIVLPGKHNLENALAAIAVAKLNGISNAHIENIFRHFQGVEHRMQFVGGINGRRFYNDSKATNTLATINALEGFEKKVILLAGGLDRGTDFNDLVPALRKHVKQLFTFGETAETLCQTGKEADVAVCVNTQTLEKAVRTAYASSSPGDVLLLSPACASWDAYKNFEARGQDFIEAVTHLEANENKGE
ncbi:UDP-N-acetylmuramoylalanine--D-glutamate ligase [Alkalibacterium sp. AK22]|uniref:UDP-N-acetylmuramoyl-L-alanine--D-glutamate ligase n=1 Tax=Alkalibacterium sp. AK22 TaxID=1229520 RepID=UPI00044C0C76|nr:UDP-N-acetylmuramoyl-L-alanine--D-glutamate ligase [Alkalibacterium sp. AK22]EXJ22857.1 UDP-N-acetylmuramoylalanine--D-glutamate ligase [Alkalibacterium sp. AK22]